MAEYIDPKAPLGDVALTYRWGGPTWTKWSSRGKASTGDSKLGRYEVEPGLTVNSEFDVRSSGVHWRIRLKNASARPVVVGDVGFPVDLARSFSGEGTTRHYLLQHQFVSGAGSFLYWNRSSCEPLSLALLPDSGTSPEYWESQRQFTLFVHSKASGEANQARGTRWRIPQTSLTLAPHSERSFGFVLRRIEGESGLRQALVDNGGLDVQVFPGMTLPVDMSAQIAMKVNGREPKVKAEFEKDSTVRPLGKVGEYWLFEIQLKRLGENRLTVEHASGTTYLEFFATEPVETLIAKRASFVAKHQVDDATKWYDGLLAEWNNDSQVRLSPDNYDKIKGWRIYEVTCDDPGLSKPAYLASKLAEFPDQKEADVLDRYIAKFLWGGLQQTDKEPRPYAIYGIPDWHVNRNKKEGKPRDGVDHVWRCYDYPHIVLMYERMYRVARGGKVKTALPPREYLMRAFHTAVAMHTVPMEVEKWSALGTGFYNECSFLDLMEDLRSEGLLGEAKQIQDLWEAKVRHFVLGSPDLYESEYAFDSTGFESTAYLARYAVDRGEQLGISAVQAKAFQAKQLAANLFCRGCVEPAYYYLGSDYRGNGGKAFTLTYMSQMGGFGVMDYGLHDAGEPWSYLRLGMNSYLSAWALVNSGTAESNYGYWYPGRANDGASAGGFEPAPFGTTWLDQPHHRGPWYYSCESDLGFCGALRAARTLVVDDPVFGRVCVGGSFSRSGEVVRFTCRDGVRRRLSVRLKDWSVDVEVVGTRFSSQKESIVDNGGVTLATDGGAAQVMVSASTPGDYRVEAGGRTILAWSQDKGGSRTFDLPAGVTSLRISRARDL